MLEDSVHLARKLSRCGVTPTEASYNAIPDSNVSYAVPSEDRRLFQMTKASDLAIDEEFTAPLQQLATHCGIFCDLDIETGV